MLTSENGRYLSSILSAEPAAGKGPGKFSELAIQSIQWGNGYRYRLRIA